MTSPTTGSTWTIVVAAGTGSRFGSPVPKQFHVVAGRRILDWAVHAAADTSDGVVVVVPATGEVEPPAHPTTRVVVVAGGESRSASVRCGLEALPDDVGVVLVHDAARPVASPALFERVEAEVRGGADGVIPVVPVVDTLRSVGGEPVDRAGLVAVQTPQGFAIEAIRRAHRAGSEATDDATLVTKAGGRVVTVPGERWNLKVTDPTDETVVDALLRHRQLAEESP